MGRMVGRLALTMPMEFSTMAQMMGSTSAPVVVRLDRCEWGESRMGGIGKAWGTYSLRLGGRGA